MLDAKRYDAGDVEEEVTRDASQDPGRATLQRAETRLDIVGMNIERRIWHQEVADDAVLAINCYSDSSPVVGMEIQGMLTDVVKTDGSIRRTILPGGSVFYGSQCAISKIMVFLWAAWLLFGPTLADMQYFVEHVVCWTTDLGVEACSIELPDCSLAFLAWVAGKALEECRPLVNHTRRLFYRSLRIAGWSHVVGNIMKQVAKSYFGWPEVLEAIRNLTRFFRNDSWREWLIRALRDRIPGIEDLLAHFTASTAKWRFETIVESERQLEPLRALCQKEMREELFAKAQENMFINDVLQACRDARI